MRKLLMVLFSSILAVSLAVPVFAQDTGTQSAPKTETKTKAKKHTAKKATKKASKKGAETKPAAEQPKQ